MKNKIILMFASFFNLFAQENNLKNNLNNKNKYKTGQ